MYVHRSGSGPLRFNDGRVDAEKPALVDGGAPGREHAVRFLGTFLVSGSWERLDCEGNGFFLWEEMNVRKGVNVVNHFGSLASA